MLFGSEKDNREEKLEVRGAAEYVVHNKYLSRYNTTTNNDDIVQCHQVLNAKK